MVSGVMCPGSGGVLERLRRLDKEERKEMPLEKFEKLEDGISRVLEGYETLKAENSDLKEALEASGRELEELRGRVKKFDREKAQVREKVDTLLEKLHGLTQSA